MHNTILPQHVCPSVHPDAGIVVKQLNQLSCNQRCTVAKGLYTEAAEGGEGPGPDLHRQPVAHEVLVQIK